MTYYYCLNGRNIVAIVTGQCRFQSFPVSKYAEYRATGKMRFQSSDESDHLKRYGDLSWSLYDMLFKCNLHFNITYDNIIIYKSGIYITATMSLSLYALIS